MEMVLSNPTIPHAIVEDECPLNNWTTNGKFTAVADYSCTPYSRSTFIGTYQFCIFVRIYMNYTPN